MLSGAADIRGRRPEMPAEGAIKIGQIGEARFSGYLGDLAVPPERIAQQCRGLSQPLLQHVMGEALSGFFKEQMHVARRDTEQKRDRNCAQARIAAASLDLTYNGGKARGARATLSRQVARVAFHTEKQRNEVVDMRDDE